MWLQFVDDIVQTRDSLSVSLKCLFAEYKVKLSSVLINTIFLLWAKYTENTFSQFFFPSQCLLRMGIEYPDYETWSLWTMKTKCDRSADVTKKAQPDILKFSSTFVKKLIWLNKNLIFTQTDFEVVSIPIMCGSLQLDVN